MTSVNHAAGATVVAQVSGNTKGADIGGVASNLVDSNWGNLWGTSEFVDGQTSMTITLDLRSRVSICTTRVKFEGASAYLYDIETSDDGSAWALAMQRINPVRPNSATWSTAVNWWDDRASFSVGTRARFVRFIMRSRLNIWGVKIYEISTLTLSSTSLSQCSEGIVIEGTLNVGSDVYISTAFIRVAPSGSLRVGTQTSPASNVTLWLEHHDCYWMEDGSAAKAACLRRGQLVSEGITRIFGVPKTSWSWLAAEAAAGASSIQVESCMGWEVGDRIVLGPTGHAVPWAMRHDRSSASEAYISSVSPGASSCTVGLAGALTRTHHACANCDGVRKYAEVSNLRRSVEISGPYYWRDRADMWHDVRPQHGGQGIVTSQRHGGLMTMSHVHVRNCGRLIVGEYCLHLHLLGVCPNCRFDGVVVTESANKAITIHGTHMATIQDAVIYNHKGASVYMQNGAEYDNVLNNSVILCEAQTVGYRLLKNVSDASVPAGWRLTNTTQSIRACTCVQCVRGQEDADNNEQAGVYLVSPNNKLLNNVVSSMENAVFVNQAGRALSGADAAGGKVCPPNQPIGETKGNVFKNNIGFGWYGNSLWPLQVAHTVAGTVTDWEQCHPFDLDTGADRHFNSVFEDHTEYGGNFGFGGYSLGDVTLRNYRTSNQGGTYWKTYHRSPTSGPLCDGCFFGNGLLAPGGDALVEYRNTTFAKGRIGINHHCNLWAEATGGMCASHFYVNSPILSHTQGLVWINEARDGETDALVTFNGRTRFLKGTGTAGDGKVGAYYIFDDSGCVDELHWGQLWRACPESWKLRTVKIYSLDRGPLTVSSGGVTKTVNMRSQYAKWAGSLGYTKVGPKDAGLVHTPRGYSFVVRADGSDVTVHIGTSLTKPEGWMDHFVLDLGHHGWEREEQIGHVRLTVTGDPALSGGPCWVHENASRAFITGFGSLISDAGEWVRCKRSMGSLWPLEYTQADYAAGFRRVHRKWWRD